jgi:hypothetical protein
MSSKRLASNSQTKAEEVASAARNRGAQVQVMHSKDGTTVVASFPSTRYELQERGGWWCADKVEDTRALSEFIRSVNRKAALDELSAMTQEMGGYEHD